ncbi:hypothetical protein ACLKA7_000736 [Drosophila subpalustris]
MSESNGQEANGQPPTKVRKMNFTTNHDEPENNSGTQLRREIEGLRRDVNEFKENVNASFENLAKEIKAEIGFLAEKMGAQNAYLRQILQRGAQSTEAQGSTFPITSIEELMAIDLQISPENRQIYVSSRCVLNFVIFYRLYPLFYVGDYMNRVQILIVDRESKFWPKRKKPLTLLWEVSSRCVLNFVIFYRLYPLFYVGDYMNRVQILIVDRESKLWPKRKKPLTLLWEVYVSSRCVLNFVIFYRLYPLFYVGDYMNRVQILIVDRESKFWPKRKKPLTLLWEVYVR